MGLEDQRRCRSGEDRISCLSDELLHDILVRLRCAYAASRTSVLSRRWRHVWAHMPELHLVAPRGVNANLFPPAVDAALRGYLAPTLEHLSIVLASNYKDGPFLHIAPWFRFAAEHLVGELHLSVPRRQAGVLELPACERAKRIFLFMSSSKEATWLRPQASGLFKALTYLEINGFVHMKGRDLTALVSTQCPCLRELIIFVELIAIFDVSIHCNSLHTTVLRILKTRQLELVAPRLEELTIYDQPKEARISAPKLVKVAWEAAYDPHLHRFVDVGRNLRLLRTSVLALSLTNQFHGVYELDLNINLKYPEVYEVKFAIGRYSIAEARYESFLNGTNKLPKCNSFKLQLYWKHHALVPIMLRLLRSCSGTKKLQVQLLGGWPPGPGTREYLCVPLCYCRLEESRKIDGIDLSSLEEVEITGFHSSREEMELVEFISCNSGILKRLVIISGMSFPMSKDVREKVRSMCHSNVKTVFYVYCGGGRQDCFKHFQEWVCQADVNKDTTPFEDGAYHIWPNLDFGQ